MSFVVFLAKCYIVILLFRFVTTKQELIFNPLGKIIAKATNPVLPKNNERFIPLLIAAVIIITSLLYSISSTAVEFQVKLLSILINYAHFFMLFYIVSMIFGSFGNRPIGGGFIALFFRLGLPWVKMTRLFIPINSGKIIIPAIIVVYLLTVCLTAVINTIFNLVIYQSIGNTAGIFISAFASGAYKVFGLLYYMSFVIAFRALISWVSPDPRNIIVQLVYTITEPVLEPLRRVIPPIGIIDFSALIAMIGFYFGGMILQNIVQPFI